MPELFIAKQLLDRIRSDRPGGWWEAFQPSIVREDGGAVVLDTGHAAYARAAREYGPLLQWKNKGASGGGNGAATPAREVRKSPQAATPGRDPRSRLWLELHRRPLDSADLRAEAQWLAQFAARVPCGDCRKHWRRLMVDTPPDFQSWAASPEAKLAYARWTWTIHNAVNALIKKPQFSWEEAVVLHNWQSICPSAGKV